MNILFYLHQFPAFGGIETVTATWSNYLTSCGHRVWIVSHRESPQSCTALTLDPHVRVLHMPGRKWTCRANREMLEQVAAREKIDVIVFQDSYARIEHNLDGLWNKLPVIVYEHNAPLCARPPRPVRLSPRALLLWIYRLWFKPFFEAKRKCYLYSHCNSYVLLSSRFYGEFRAITKLVDWRKLRALPNPVSPVFLKDSCGGKDLFLKKEKIVLCSATLTYLKGQDILLHVWEKIASRCPDWRLVFAGDGPDHAKLEAVVRERRMPRVEFLGYVGDMKPLYTRASILAAPSRREGWLLVLHEAMSQGCVPVVFNSYSAVYDVVDDGGNALVIPSFDEKAFGRGLSILMSDSDRLRTLGKAAIEKAQSFDVSHLAEKWISLLKTATDSGGEVK